MANLKVGSKGSAVTALQNALNKAGAKPKLVADGAFGKKTAEAVKAFQKKSGLKADGIAGKATMAALGGGSGGGSAVGSSGGGSKTAPIKWTIEEPDRLVRNVQDELRNTRGYDRLYDELSRGTSKAERDLFDEYHYHRSVHNQVGERLRDAVKYLVQLRQKFRKVEGSDPKAAKRILADAKAAYDEYNELMTRWAECITGMQSVNKRYQKLPA
ncbi:MAG: peptidoglycan-binding domain-containing protein [Pseudomonadota bacterium]